jgi:hypothetical protein
LIQQREGAAYDELRARVAIHVTGAVIDLALDSYVELPDAELADLFTEAISIARTVFA